MSSPTATATSSPVSPTSPSRTSRFIEETILVDPRQRSLHSHAQYQHKQQQSSFSAVSRTPPKLLEFLHEMDEFERRRSSSSSSGSSTCRGSGSGSPKTTLHQNIVASTTTEDRDGVASKLKDRFRALATGRNAG